jgi:hypothetical protein
MGFGMGLEVCEITGEIRGGFPEGGVLVVVCPRAGEFCKLPAAGCRVEANSRDCRLAKGSCRLGVDGVLEAGVWEEGCGGILAGSDRDRDVLNGVSIDF